MSGSTPSNPSPAGGDRLLPGIRILSFVCRHLLGAVFLMAGASKVPRLADFIDRLTLLGVPAPLARSAGALVPWLELVIGTCLVLGVMRRESALLGGTLLIVFTAFLFLRTSPGECDCFLVPGAPGLSRDEGWQLLPRNLALLVAVAVVLWRPLDPAEISCNRPPPRGTHQL